MSKEAIRNAGLKYAKFINENKGKGKAKTIARRNALIEYQNEIKAAHKKDDN